MAYYDYKYLNENKVGFGWIDISSKINNVTALAFSRNITEYWVQELSNYNLKVTCKNSHDDVLKWAVEEDLNYIIVATIGNNLSKNYSFIEELPAWLENNKEFSIIGHVLDKQDKYYELHHQFFMVNIAWWKSVGCPEIGKEENSVEWSTVEPARSQQNWHDGYTPHWIENGSSNKTYTGKRFGWNIIKAALESNNRVNSFNEKQRDSKYYLYPEVNKDTHFKFHTVFDSLQSFSHFIANTETPPPKILDVDFDGVICTAGGVTPLLSAWAANLKPNDMLTIIDVSPLSLAIQKSLFDKKCDYRNFKNDFYSVISSFNEEQLAPMFRAQRNIDKMQEILNGLMEKQGLAEFIDNVWPTLRINYNFYDIFNVDGLPNILNRFSESRNVYMHLTNMLHYQNTSWVYSSDNRYSIEKKLADTLYKFGADKFRLYQNRPGNNHWRNVTPRTILDNPAFYLAEVENLKELPWKKK